MVVIDDDNRILVTKQYRHARRIINGTDWATGTSTGTLTFVQYDSSFPSYTGHFTQWFGQNDNLMNGNGTFTFSVHATGSDGSMLLYHEGGHYSVSATGVNRPQNFRTDLEGVQAGWR